MSADRRHEPFPYFGFINFSNGGGRMIGVAIAGIIPHVLLADLPWMKGWGIGISSNTASFDTVVVLNCTHDPRERP